MGAAKGRMAGRVCRVPVSLHPGAGTQDTLRTVTLQVQAPAPAAGAGALQKRRRVVSKPRTHSGAHQDPGPGAGKPVHEALPGVAGAGQKLAPLSPTAASSICA